jgi:hypothetical protein
MLERKETYVEKGAPLSGLLFKLPLIYLNLTILKGLRLPCSDLRK